MNLIRSALFALLFYPVTVAAVLLALAAIPFGQRPVIRIAVGWMRAHRLLAVSILGIRTRIEGAIPTGACLIAAKHQSMYETLELVRVTHEPVVVLKRELADIPGWGGIARRYGVIAVAREAGASALREMMKQGKLAIAQNRALLIFPEGTRVAPGEQPPLASGFAGLYRTLGLPVVPVALDSGRLWPRRSFMKRPGIVTFRFGEPIPPGLPRAEIERRVHAAINALEPPL